MMDFWQIASGILAKFDPIYTVKKKLPCKKAYTVKKTYRYTVKNPHF